MAFQRIDRDANEAITSCEIFNFLRENCVYSISEGELFRIVKFFDNNEDGRLSYTEFEQMLLPCEDNCLRRMAQERRAYRVARYENLPLDIERAIAGIIEREVELLRRLDLLKRELEVRYDFSPYACFKTVDRYAEGFINVNNLAIFLRANGFYPSDRDLSAIIRRVDTSCISKVNYSDFADFLRAHGSADMCSSAPSTTLRSASAGGRHASNSLVDKSAEKPRAQSSMRLSGAKKSPKTAHSPGKKACCDDCADKGTKCSEEPRPASVLCPPLCYPLYPYRPLICDPCRPVFCDPCRPVVCDPCRPVVCDPCRPVVYDPCRPLVCDPCRPVVCDPCRPVCRPCLPSSTEYELVKGLYDIIREERDLESAKINLARRSDFNFYDAFKIFDPTSKGYVTLADLREGLAAIGVFPTSSDMELYIKRYDKYNERKVRFSDFCESFTP